MENDNILKFKNTPYLKLAHGYFPFQQLKEPIVSIKMLENGTIFPELIMPYMDRQDNIDE